MVTAAGSIDETMCKLNPGLVVPMPTLPFVNQELPKIGNLVKSGNMVGKILLFLLSSVLVVVLYPLIIMILFKHFIIGGEINITKYIKKIKNKKKINNDEYLDIETLDPNDYELINMNNIERIGNE